MGSVVGTAANGVGTFLGNALIAPLRTLFGVSCEGVCSGTWDVACFLEHLCVSRLARLFMVLVLTYITLFFVYLMCKVGIIQCVVKNACKMAAAACSGCCRGLGATSCLLWRKVRDTKRLHRGRRRRQDNETGEVGCFGEEEESPSDDDHGSRHGRSLSGNHGRWGRAREGSSVRERRKDRLWRSLRLRRLASKKQRSTGRSYRASDARVMRQDSRLIPLESALEDSRLIPHWSPRSRGRPGPSDAPQSFALEVGLDSHY